MKTSYIFCKVIAGASRCSFSYDLVRQMFKITVHAPRDNGKANRAVCEYLAAILSLPKTSLSIVSGFATTIKKVAIISSYEEAQLFARLLELCTE